MIGAGISGLAAARELLSAGFEVSVFEKSRGVGGRMATRRTAGGLFFDHGAQYFTVRDDRFQQFVDACVAAGAAEVWPGRIGVWGTSDPSSGPSGSKRYVGVPGMNALCGELAKGIELRLECRVAPPEYADGAWRLCDHDGESLGSFEGLIVSTPAPQAAELLAASPELSQLAGAVAMSGCWAAMVAFDESIPTECDGAFVHGSPLSWVARNGSKPGRAPEPDSWVLHASPDWSAANLEREPADVLPDLLSAFWQVSRMPEQSPAYATCHRWRYALPPDPLAERCLFDAERRGGACGDWCGGPRVEGAYLSGLAVAQAMVAAVD